MRIVMVSTSYPLTPESVSGIFVKRLVAHLTPGVTVTVVTPCGQQTGERAGGDGETGRVVCFRYAPRRWRILAHRPGGLPVALRNHPLALLLLPGFLLGLFLAVLRAGREADLIHANWSVVGVVAGMAGWLLHKPVATTLRGADVNRAATSPVARLLLRLCLRLNDRVVAVSEAIAADMRALAPERAHKIVMIPNGIDTERFRPGGADDTASTLLTVGSLIPRKGVHRILEALAPLKDAHRFRLLVAGDGPEAPRLKALADRLGLSERVAFLGELPPEAIPALLSRAGVFILASDGEGRANAVLEAMAAGLPVIASDIGGMSELVRHEDNGLLFDLHDPAALTRTIARLLEQTGTARAMGQRGRQRLGAMGLDWNATAATYRSLWSAILEGSPPCAG